MIIKMKNDDLIQSVNFVQNGVIYLQDSQKIYFYINLYPTSFTNAVTRPSSSVWLPSDWYVWMTQIEVSISDISFGKMP